MVAPKITPLTWTPARQVLEHEAHDFTPWLAENLDLLCAPLGLDEFELVSTEWKVESFSLDILAKGSDADGDVTVVIENQYGDTNHGHLGQLITYAAGAAAQGGRVLAVWLTEEVRPAHLAAVEFLNRISAGEESAFGMVLLRVRFTPSPNGFYVFFEVEAQPNSFISSTPHPGPKSSPAIAAKGDFIDAVAADLDPLVLATGLQRHGQVNRKHGAVAYRFPKSMELSECGTLRVVCTSTYTNVAIYLGRQPTPEGNYAVAELLRQTYEDLVDQYGLHIDTWHGSGASTKRDRVITKLDQGYGSGSPSEVAKQASELVSAWMQMLSEHPLTSIAETIRNES